MSKRARSTRGFPRQPWSCLSFLQVYQQDLFFGPQWINLFQTNENVYRELVNEFFASFEFDASPCRYDPNHLGVRFRLEGEQKDISLLELGWRIGFQPTIEDDGFNVRNTKVAAIRDPKVKLAHRCIAMPLQVERKAFIGSPKLTYSTFIASTPTRELHNEGCFWPASREAVEEDKEDDKADEAAGGGAGHEGARGSAEIYRNMSQVLSSNLTNKITCKKFLIKTRKDFSQTLETASGLTPNGVASPGM
nr:hypothetical protein [Tanacetum cinerariifolium]